MERETTAIDTSPHGDNSAQGAAAALESWFRRSKDACQDDFTDHDRTLHRCFRPAIAIELDSGFRGERRVPCIITDDGHGHDGRFSRSPVTSRTTARDGRQRSLTGRCRLGHLCQKLARPPALHMIAASRIGGRTGIQEADQEQTRQQLCAQCEPARSMRGVRRTQARFRHHPFQRRAGRPSIVVSLGYWRLCTP